MYQRLLHICLIGVLCFAYPSKGELEVEITRGTMAPVPIAITKLISSGGTHNNVAKDITQVITTDLKGSGLFQTIDPRAFIQSSEDANRNPRFADWRVLQAQALLVGKVHDRGGGMLTVEFVLYDVLTEQQIEGRSFTTTIKDWRRLAHKVADTVYKRITGEEGYFDTRIVYVAEAGQGKSRKTRLAMLDQDGHNHFYLTDGQRNVLSPRFSPKVQHITFMDYGADNKTPRVYIMDINTRRFRKLGISKTMTYAPRFSPSGNSVIISLVENGNSSLYEMNLQTHIIQRLTFGRVIDASASYSPDGLRVVFTSDRRGNPQLYVMNSDGTNIQRLSYGGGRYSTPVWSPRGDLIAFTKLYQGNFYIGIMRADGTGERLLAQGYMVEEPTWAPNGRLLIFTRQQRTGKSGLYMIDLTGHNERKVPTPHNVSALHAAWSPLLP